MVAWLGDPLFPCQKLPVMFSNDGPTLINDYPLPVFQHFDIFADQGVGHRVAIGVKMDVSLNVHCPLRGKIDRWRYFRQGLQGWLLYEPGLRWAHPQAALWFAVGNLVASCPGLEIKIMPVGEGSTGQEISFYIVKRPLDPGLSIWVVNPMRPEMNTIDSGKGIHFRGE